MKWFSLLLLSTVASAAPIAEPKAEAVPAAVANAEAVAAAAPEANTSTNKQEVKCKLVKDAITAFREQNKATKFCASWLHTSTANGCTTTVKKTETKYTTTTITGTNTATVTTTAATVTTTGTAYVTKYETKTITKEETSVTGTTTEVAAITCGPISGTLNKRSPEAHNKRVATEPKPQCFDKWTDKAAVSSACKCLSITATTATVTSYTTTTKTCTVTQGGQPNTVTITPTATSTAYVTKYETKYVTTTTTKSVAATVTRAGALQTPATFKIYTPSSAGGPSKYAMSANSDNPTSQLQRVLFSPATPGIFEFSGTSKIREVSTQKFFVALNTAAGGGNTTDGTTPPLGSGNTTDGTTPPLGSGNTTDGETPPLGTRSTDTSDIPEAGSIVAPRDGPNSIAGVKLVSEASYDSSGMQYLECSVVAVVMGSGFACQLKCTAYTTRIINQLDTDSAWLLVDQPSTGLTTFQPFIEAVAS